MPKKLTKLVTRDIIAFTHQDLESQRDIIENPECYKNLTKGNSLFLSSKEKKIKKVLKDSQKASSEKEASEKDANDKKERKKKRVRNK
jgi:hypothetical protein